MTLTSIIVKKIRSSYDRRNRNLAVNTTYTALSKMFQTWNDKLTVVYWNHFILNFFSVVFHTKFLEVVQMMFISARCSTLNIIPQYFDIFLTLSFSGHKFSSLWDSFRSLPLLRDLADLLH